MTEHPRNLDAGQAGGTPFDTHAIARNIASLREHIATITRAAGRESGSVNLVAVSKTFGAPAIEAALAAGQTSFGENRVQEAAAKFPTLRGRYPGLRLHLIGTLQSNKARDAVRLADVIESLDRESLADALANAAQREGRLPTLLMQVNVGGEPQKSGILREHAADFLALCRGRFGAALQGVMAIPPASGDPAPHFTWLARFAAAQGLPIVSMGMSQDYEAAILAGATEIRVGGAIFGNRPQAG